MRSEKPYTKLENVFEIFMTSHRGETEEYSEKKLKFASSYSGFVKI